MKEQTLRERLIELAEPAYQKFSSTLLPDTEGILGVRLPLLRKLAKETAGGDWRSFLEYAPEDYFEEKMLKGMIIGCCKADLEEKLYYIQKFVPAIDNWSVCDSFCSSLKFTKRHLEEIWQFLQVYIMSEKEFEVRFAVVMILNYFVLPEYADRVFGLFAQINTNAYYASMAVAWAVSVYFVHMPEKTTEFLLQDKLEEKTYHRTLKKIIESKRVGKEGKDKVRSIKNKAEKSVIA